MKVRDWNPADGCAFQGDIALVPVPDGIKIDTADETQPVAGRLILQEGELSGHHHAISAADPADPRAKHFRRPGAGVEQTLEGLMADAGSRRMPGASAPMAARAIAEEAGRMAAERDGLNSIGTARLYRDPAAAAAMIAAKIIERADLMIGFLIIEGAPVIVRHEEHDGIRVPPGRYYCGRQMESAGADEQVVAD